MVGIVRYGAYLPKHTIERDEYVKARNIFLVKGINEKTIPSFDEDTITMGVGAI